MKLPRLCLLALSLLLATSATTAHADDGIFPPAPAAASSIDFDGRGFLIHGKRTFIASGGLEYARIPHALWRDRLLRLKRAGFNCVEVYTFWNWHEPRPGVFDFTGDHDLGAFLKLARSMDLYAIVRVGPYYCAEWDSGGYPVWLRFAPGVRVREDNPEFKAAVRRFWGKLIPIVAANQINHGGSVIMVQLENEHPLGWGKEIPNPYFTFLRDTALELGVEVPYFFSGLHHGNDPAGDNAWSSAGRTSPWLTTEFWSVWYSAYGSRPSDLVFDRRFWKVLAYGGNGLNFYMLHGGTNFGYTNNDEDASSYDYGAAIGQAGDLRPLYYRFKRAALFARSFEAILEDSDNATDAYSSAATNPAVRVTARKSPSGTILFLDNNGKSAVQTQTKETDGTFFPASGPVTLEPGQILPIVHDFPLLPGVTLERATPLLGIQHSGSMTTLVAYAPEGDAAELRFHVTKPVTQNHGGILKGDRLTISDAVNGITTTQSSFRVGEQTIRVLTMTRDYSDQTWFVGNNVLVGSEYVGDATTANGKLRVTTEYRNGASAPPMLFVFGPSASTKKAEATLLPASEAATLPHAPALTAWQALPGDLEAAPSYSDTGWKASTDPLPMGADGDSSAYAWYRSIATLPSTGSYRLRVANGGDWGSLFVNGQHISSGPIAKGLPVTLPAGTSQLAVLTAHNGRPKLYAYLGPINTIEAKGLAGPARLDAGIAATTPITTWRIKADDTPDKANPPTDTTGIGWTDGTTGPEVFNGRKGFTWYRTTLPPDTVPQHSLHFENVDDNATVYLNGKPVATHQGWNIPYDAPLDAAWKKDGPNELAVLVENIANGGGILGAVTLETFQPGEVVPIPNWKMHGGINEPATLTGWQSLTTPRTDGAPAFYRTTFSAAAPGATGPHPILRVTTQGLSRGFVWLNGHNLGRYPEKIPIDGLYLPEPWLKASGNEIVIFDEDGRSPASVKLTVEQAASRFVTMLR